MDPTTFQFTTAARAVTKKLRLYLPDGMPALVQGARVDFYTAHQKKPVRFAIPPFRLPD